MTLHKIFFVPLISFRFSKHSKYFFPDIERSDNIPQGWTQSINSSYPRIKDDDKIVSSDVRDNLIKDLHEEMTQVFKEEKMCFNFSIRDFWYNIYHDDQGQEKHNHLSWVGTKNLYWCGIYYNKNASPTEFHRGNGWYETQRFPDYQNTAMKHVLSDVFYSPVEDGDILLFPSWLNHSVTSKPHHKDKMRMTFSFNIELASLNIGGHDIIPS